MEEVLGSWDQLCEKVKSDLRFSLWNNAREGQPQAWGDRLTEKEAKKVYESYCMEEWTFGEFVENGLLSI